MKDDLDVTDSFSQQILIEHILWASAVQALRKLQ